MPDASCDPAVNGADSEVKPATVVAAFSETMQEDYPTRQTPHTRQLTSQF